MADHEAIAAVSRTLKALLQSEMEEGAPVSLRPPDKASGKTCLNLYLFEVRENAALANQELSVPLQGHVDGQSHLALDLLYLMTPFSAADEGEDGDVEAQRVLGDGMRVFHDFAIITDTLFAAKPPEAAGKPVLDAKLLNESEHLRITLERYSLEELNKLWSAFPTTSFRRSVVYHVSVVQIASRRPRRAPRLVGEPPRQGPRVIVTTLRTPRIDEIRVTRPGGATESRFPLARVGDTLILLGSQLFDDDNRAVRLGTVEFVPDLDRHKAQRVEFEVPDNPALKTGPVTVQVLLGPRINDKNPNLLFRSNVAAFMLVPRVDGVTYDPAVDPTFVEITGDRLFEPGRECAAIIGKYVIADFEAPVDPTNITFRLPERLPAGKHPVRVRIDDAESIDEVTIDI